MVDDKRVSAGMTSVVAVVHPPERSGLHSFWRARVSALGARGIAVTLLVPESLPDRDFAALDDMQVRRVNFSRPRALANPVENARHLARLHSDATLLSRAAAEVGATTIVSHGVHFLTAALAARIDAHLRHVVLIHSDSPPRMLATLMHAVRPPDRAGVELDSGTKRYARLQPREGWFRIAPLLAPTLGAPGPGSRSVGTPHSGNGRRTIVFAAALSPRKRPELFLDMVEMMSGSPAHRELAYRVIGVYTDSHSEWARNVVVPRIHELRGRGVDVEFVDGADGARAHIARADVLVITSRSEGIPNVALEAIAERVPVVSVDLEGVRQLQRLAEEHGQSDLVRVVSGHGSVVENLVAAVAQSLSLDRASKVAQRVAESVQSADAVNLLASALRGGGPHHD
tara:strand:+ start:3034 stop:4230 length:1197 start_codon:yes stop_codon:yes gene_type:complete